MSTSLDNPLETHAQATHLGSATMAVHVIVRRWGLSAMGIALGTFATLAPAAAQGVENWVAKNAFDPFTSKSHCVAESVHQRMHDGYQETAIYLQVDANGLTVITESNIDPESPHNGIRVDDNDVMKPDKFRHEQRAVFERDATHIIEQFRRGLKVAVTLKFWPTWPDKGRQTAEFSLIGFTKAFAQLPDC